MRHLTSLIAAIVIAPLAWVLIAFGQDRSAAVFANQQDNGALHTHDLIRPLIFLAAAGILFGLIATLRFSPAGPVLAGVVYAASYVALLFDSKGVNDLLGYQIHVFGQRGQLMTPVRTGTTLIIGALLLVAVASISRWRRYPAPVGDTRVGEPLTESPLSTSPLLGTSSGFGDTSPLLTGQSMSGADQPESTPPLGLDAGAPARAGSPWDLPLREGNEPKER